jgi:hypothetical protein
MKNKERIMKNEEYENNLFDMEDLS